MTYDGTCYECYEDKKYIYILKVITLNWINKKVCTSLKMEGYKHRISLF